jgi:two-component system cell cycle response regulator DivK
MSTNDKTIIIADDHETSVMYLSILIRRMGFTVIPARNGEEVLHVLETILPDLVITDRKMPIVDGLTTLKMMKDDPRFADIPVIMVSAHFEQEDVDECMELGGIGYLTKPINLNDLSHLLRECIIYSNNMKRKNMRVAYGRKVMVEHDDQMLEHYAVTLSEQGIYLRTQNPMPVGTKVQIHLKIQDGFFLTAQGAVIYHKGVTTDINKMDPGMAIKFDDFSTQYADVLNAHIMDVLAGDLVEEQQDPVIETGSLNFRTVQDNLSELKQSWRQG